MRCHRAFECKNYIATFGEDQSNKQVQKKQASYTVITRIPQIFCGDSHISIYFFLNMRYTKGKGKGPFFYEGNTRQSPRVTDVTCGPRCAPFTPFVNAPFYVYSKLQLHGS